ncbi:hypothetical protein D3C72_1646190 [compost metagenome]
MGTTAFHVTTAPMEKLISHCIKIKRAGYRPVILTLESKVIAARQMADNVGMSELIAIQAAELSSVTILKRLLSMTAIKSVRVSQD